MHGEVCAYFGCVSNEVETVDFGDDGVEEKDTGGVANPSVVSGCFVRNTFDVEGGMDLLSVTC